MATDDSTSTDLELTEHILPVVNDILTRFNEENIGPREAGSIIIALLHRLLQVLDDSPDAQREIALAVVQLINQHLAGRLGDDPGGACSCC